MATQLTIGGMAKATDCNIQTIRYYEQVGLLRKPERSKGNQRLYGRPDVERLTFIRHARDLGFPLDAVRDLLSLSDRPDQPCEAADAIARAQLVHVQRRIDQLEALRAELHRMVDQCSGGRISDCRVIEVLGNHALCEVHGHGAVDV